jgi:hypothetical protein
MVRSSPSARTVRPDEVTDMTVATVPFARRRVVEVNVAVQQDAIAGLIDAGRSPAGSFYRLTPDDTPFGKNDADAVGHVFAVGVGHRQRGDVLTAVTTECFYDCFGHGLASSFRVGGVMFQASAFS